MNTLLEKCGLEAEAAFAAAEKDAAAFTQTACDLFGKWDLASEVSLDTLFEAAKRTEIADQGGSQKPGLIELFRGEHVRMVAHLWSDAADRLHQHDWTGAFQVIEGQSFNAIYEFVETARIEEFSIGALARTDLKIFEPGAIQPVIEGGGLIHSVVYSGKPGMAISLRVAGEGARGAFEYLRPGLRAPSHRRRGNSASQVDLLAQALQVDEELYWQRLAELAGNLSGAGLLRLLDAAAFDGLPLPGDPPDMIVARLPEAGLILESLNDIERSDKTRELLSEHSHPELRKVICAMFHSDNRTELQESLRRAGFAEPVRAIGLALGALLIDAEESDAPPPDHLIDALGEAALTGNISEALTAMAVAGKGAPYLQDHAAFVRQAFDSMEEAPFFRCLLKP
ncbi:hypothetical protein [Hyphobacterium sp.]|uniref:hypothetical protein n=1 Tax=Hyphobacterium sp. TaxID=2004662 RepID=UPI003BAD682F